MSAPIMANEDNTSQQHHDYDEDRDRRRWSPRRNDRSKYRDDYHSRQDYSRSPPRDELSYDDVPGDQEEGEWAGPASYDDGGAHGSSHGDDRGWSRGRSRGSDYPPEEYYGRDHDDGRRYDYGEGAPYDGLDGHHRRGRSPSPMRNAGTPSDTVILEGLPPNVQVDEVRECLSRYEDMERYPSFDVRVPSGRGRRAFVQFETTDDAVDFVQANYPKMFLDFQGAVDGDADGRTPVYIHFARSRDENESRGSGQANNASWTCLTCNFSNFSTRQRCKTCGGARNEAPYKRYNLTGESDAADVPSQILVFYPLAPSVTEEVLATGAARLELEKPVTSKQNSGEPPKLKSTAPVGDTTGYGARPGSIHRVFLIRDRQSNESYNFGFAEFWTVDDALAAMTKFRKFRDFTIASASTTVSTIHTGVFIPETREVMSATVERQSFQPLFNPAIRVKYWDPRVFPSQKVITETSPDANKEQADSNDAESDSKKSKKRKADASLPVSSSKRPVAMVGQMAKWQKKHDELHDGNEKAGTRTSPEKNLSGGFSSANTGPIKIALTGKSLSQPAAAAPKPSTSPPAPDQTTPDAVSYVDREKVCCLLCMMKYKSLDDLNTHERSRNHKTAMTDETKVKAAQPRVAARDKRMQKSSPPAPSSTSASIANANANEPTGPQYRDRAKERRVVYNQPSKPSPSQTQSASHNNSSTSSTSAQSTKPREQSPAAAPAPPVSKGSAMLAKMGWSAGQGLGAKGEGRTEVIATHAYQEGVGLGAEGSNLGDAAELASRKTRDGYGEYLSAAQEKARERYNRMS